MPYTKGIYESAIQAIYDRIVSHTGTGGKLADFKDKIVIGQRSRTTGDDAFPRIAINLNSYSEQTTTMAGSAGQKSGKMDMEFRIEVEKLKDSTKAAYANNVLFDGAGKGAVAYFQWFLDSMNSTSAGVWNPCLNLSLDILPDASFTIDEHSTSIEIVALITFQIRYTMGSLGGVIS